MIILLIYINSVVCKKLSREMKNTVINCKDLYSNLIKGEKNGKQRIDGKSQRIIIW